MKDLVAEILSPRKPIRVNKKTYWVTQNIPWELKIKAGLVYQQVMDEFRFSGMFRREQVKPLLNLFNIPIDQVDKWNEQIKNLKVDLYKKFPDEFSQKPIRSELKSVKKEIAQVNYQFVSLDNCTLESFAEKKSAFYTLKNLCKAPRSYNFMEKLYTEFLISSPSIPQIRKLARSEYWRIYWGTKKGLAFKYTPMTDEQLSLASYSKMYDSVFKHTDTPPDPVIQDDDMLDGWLILQSKQEEKQPDYGAKINSSKEVFIMTKTQDHANKIYSMNTDEQRAVQNVRGKQLKRQGTMEFGKFADQQQERMMERARQ